MVRAEVIQCQHRSTGRKLRKLRRRYIRVCKPAIEVDHSLLWPCAEKPLARGLYAPSTTIKHVRYAILRGMSILDGCPHLETLRMWKEKRFGWHEWLLAKGWGSRWWDKSYERKAA